MATENNAHLIGYQDLTMYVGDIHSHCSTGYGHGSLEDAFRNAKMQLDFACVTVHAHWGDLPKDKAQLKAVVDYHQQGFERTRAQWKDSVALVESHNEPGVFISFLGYEWHSLEYGDHNIYFKQAKGDIIRKEHLEDIRAELRNYQNQGIDCMLLPHHIGYKQSYRGINWKTYSEEFSPVVEIMSMHGASESAEAPYPYLHTMGPRDGQSLYQYGLAQGNIVGVMASTDHHSAHPGSYGHGRLAVWANNLSREGIWQAIQKRQTVALTGDNIKVQFAVNNAPIGSVIPFARQRKLDIAVSGGSSIDYVDVVHNNKLIHRWNSYETNLNSKPKQVKLHFELGWAEKNLDVDWQVELNIKKGKLLGVEPRFRGHDIVEPQKGEQRSYAFSKWTQESNRLQFSTRTWGNATTTTASTQGLCMDISIDADTYIEGIINGQTIKILVQDLLAQPKAFYLGDFLSPACYFHRAIPISESTCRFTYHHKGEGHQRDWYYLRVCQHNGQWAWSSPIWIEATKTIESLP